MSDWSLCIVFLVAVIIIIIGISSILRKQDNSGGSSHSDEGKDLPIIQKAISFLIPIAGLILGFIYVSQKEKKFSASAFSCAILGIVVGAVVTGICLAM